MPRPGQSPHPDYGQKILRRSEHRTNAIAKVGLKDTRSFASTKLWFAVLYVTVAADLVAALLLFFFSRAYAAGLLLLLVFVDLSL